MLTIEDIVEELADQIAFERRSVPVELSSGFYPRFLTSVANRTRKGYPLSSRQAKTAIKAAKLSRDHMVEIYGSAYDTLLNNPKYRKETYKSVRVAREVRWLGYGKIGLRSNYIPEIRDEVRWLIPYENWPPPVYDITTKMWIVDVTKNTYHRILEIVAKYDFEYDEDFLLGMAEAKDSIGKKTAIVYDEETNSFVIQAFDDPFMSIWASNFPECIEV